MLHKVFGYLILVVAQATILLGGLAYANLAVNPLAKDVSIGAFGLFFLIVVALEIYHRLYRLRREVNYLDPNNAISREEFDRRVHTGGEQLVILDDLVLDVRKFKSEHPGGQFLLDFHVGRDIGKYFYGGYVLENGTGLKPYRHSNVARMIVNDLAVAKLGCSSS